MSLVEYILTYTTRGECKCGQCIDRRSSPDPIGHSVDMIFFQVATANHPTLAEFIELSRSHQSEFEDVDPFDGKEHSYIELGGWLGDQGIALQYMALGHMLEAFTVDTPRSMLGSDLSEDIVRDMAGMGLVTVTYTPTSV